MRPPLTQWQRLYEMYNEGEFRVVDLAGIGPPHSHSCLLFLQKPLLSKVKLRCTEIRGRLSYLFYPFRFFPNIIQNTTMIGGIKIVKTNATRTQVRVSIRSDLATTFSYSCFTALRLIPGGLPILSRDQSGGAQARAHRSAFSRTLAREWSGAKLSCFRASFRLQGRTTDGLRERLPRVVMSLRLKIVYES